MLRITLAGDGRLGNSFWYSRGKQAMLSVAEFRTGSLSLPATEGDEVPPCCFACPYLAYKEFSMNEAEGLYYYYCAYHTPGRLPQEAAPCLTEEG